MMGIPVLTKADQFQPRSSPLRSWQGNQCECWCIIVQTGSSEMHHCSDWEQWVQTEGERESYGDKNSSDYILRSIIIWKYLRKILRLPRKPRVPYWDGSQAFGATPYGVKPCWATAPSTTFQVVTNVVPVYHVTCPWKRAVDGRHPLPWSHLWILLWKTWHPFWSRSRGFLPTFSSVTYQLQNSASWISKSVSIKMRPVSVWLHIVSRDGQIGVL